MTTVNFFTYYCIVSYCIVPYFGKLVFLTLSLPLVQMYIINTSATLVDLHFKHSSLQYAVSSKFWLGHERIGLLCVHNIKKILPHAVA